MFNVKKTGNRINHYPARATFIIYINKFNVNNYRLKIVLSNGLLFVFGALLQTVSTDMDLRMSMSIPVIHIALVHADSCLPAGFRF